MMGAILMAAALQGAGLNWEALPPLPYRAPPIVTQEMREFVAREVRLRRCPRPGGPVQVDVAVLVDANGGIRTTVPRAIRCVTVEQYAAAAVAGFARNNLLPRSAAGEQWYRTSLTFAR